MKAFVQIHSDGEFYNENAYLAWRAFNHYGYEVVKFKDFDLNHLDIAPENPVFAGVEVTRQAFYKLGINIEDLPSYPKELNSYLGRQVDRRRLHEVLSEISSGQKFFVKPEDIKRKSFTGFVVDSDLSLLKLAGHQLDDFVLCSDVVNFLVEYRVFIHDGKILDARTYKGDFRLNLDWITIQRAVDEFSNAPIAYCLDFGLTDCGRTLLVEATDAWAFGHYGLDMVLYGKMLIDRWLEITKTNIT